MGARGSATGWFYRSFLPASTDFWFGRLDLSFLEDGGYMHWLHADKPMGYLWNAYTR